MKPTSESQQPGAAGTATGLDRNAFQASHNYRNLPSASSGGVTVLPTRRITARRRASWRLAELYRLASFRRDFGQRLDPNTWAFVLAATLAAAPQGISPIGRMGRGIRWHGLDIITLKEAIKFAGIGAFDDAELVTIIHAVDRFTEKHGHSLIRSDRMAELLAVTAEERWLCNIRTIGAVDETRQDRATRQVAEKNEKERERIRTKRAGTHVPRSVYLAGALTTSRPWEAEGVSRRTWERRRARVASVLEHQYIIHSDANRLATSGASVPLPDRDEIAA